LFLFLLPGFSSYLFPHNDDYYQQKLLPLSPLRYTPPHFVCLEFITLDDEDGAAEEEEVENLIKLDSLSQWAERKHRPSLPYSLPLQGPKISRRVTGANFLY